MSNVCNNKSAKASIGLFVPIIMSCAGSSNFSSAKMIRKGDVEFAPRIQYEHSMLDDSILPKYEMPIISAGTSVAYGASKIINLDLSYDLLKDERFRSDHLFMMNVKIGHIYDYTATSIGYGFVAEKNIQILKVAILQNGYSSNRKSYFCVSPIMLAHVLNGERYLINTRLNASYTREFGGIFRITPEIGADLLSSLLGELVSFNMAISVGLRI